MENIFYNAYLYDLKNKLFMRRLLILALAAVSLSGCGLLSAVNWDSGQLMSAAGNALTAATISNAQVVELSRQTVAQMDAQNKVDNGTYAARLNKLMKNVKVDGLDLNYKVYITKEVNAFACGDGSIRVYSGLMDVMDDSELMAIIGHEVGHVVHHDTKDAMKRAYMTAAARDVVNAAGTVGAIAQTSIGDLAEAFVGSQFSQKQEYAADDYGFSFAVKYGHSPYSMYNSLAKLVNMSGGSQASLVQKMFSSHPDSAERAMKMKAKAENYKKK